ncbi:NPC intracellular cholesterol transporter 2-like isoform 1-T1 [Cochliomyia hominivorax]
MEYADMETGLEHIYRIDIHHFHLHAAPKATTNVKKCKKGEPFPLNVDIEGCTEPPCDVVKGTTVVMYVHFVGTRDNTETLSAKVRATTFGITVPYELPDEVADVCSNLMNGATCPIYNTEDNVYKFNFFIEAYYPEISVAVEVSLIDENEETVACFICNIKVKKGATNPLILE